MPCTGPEAVVSKVQFSLSFPAGGGADAMQSNSPSARCYAGVDGPRSPIFEDHERSVL